MNDRIRESYPVTNAHQSSTELRIRLRFDCLLDIHLTELLIRSKDAFQVFVAANANRSFSEEMLRIKTRCYLCLPIRSINVDPSMRHRALV